MIPELRSEFNRSFNREQYRHFLERLDRRFDMKIGFRVMETPLFVPRGLQHECEEAAIEFALRLHQPDYLQASDRALSPEITVANQTPHSTFYAVDFAFIRDNEGNIAPRLIELQGFPSLMGYQLFLAELVQEHFALSPELSYINGGHSRQEMVDLLRRAIVADQDPRETVLLELDPWNQKTCPDFYAIRELLGISVVDIRSIVKDGRHLSYRNEEGVLVPVRRIYNRTIVDELERKGIEIPFAWNDDLDVEWAGHPNWFYRISKFSLPFLDHPLVPKARFLSEVAELPDNSTDFVLKPLFSFAGTGVIVGPTREEIASVPEEVRSHYLLQERIEFGGVVETPEGPTKAEMRVMLIWPDDADRPTPVMGLARMGRGEQMGVDANRTMEWIGASCNFFAP